MIAKIGVTFIVVGFLCRWVFERLLYEDWEIFQRKLGIYHRGVLMENCFQLLISVGVILFFVGGLIWLWK